MLDFSTPRETVLVTSRGSYKDLQGDKVRDNITAIDWHMPAGVGHFAICVSQNSMTAALIDASRVFVVNFIGVDFKDTVVRVGSVSGKTHNKFKDFKVDVDDAEGVDCGYLKKAVAYLSCHVVNRMDIEGYVVYIGKVLQHRELKVGMKRLFHVAEDRFTTTK
jgi:flavin reductase (DIM6/NTAB) family NADH-FMN oxidoreductase RutF